MSLVKYDATFVAVVKFRLTLQVGTGTTTWQRAQRLNYYSSLRYIEKLLWQLGMFILTVLTV